ncbi:MAG: acetyl-CoA carboxylase biotin carboxyl carrier protein [Candidatus Omnitrophica bacterium]|jgi:acetyl-CoA carboxylase biotin carboxyl carrier protein|nr:acetyl-CoA carboxylase biotin carboxyl carrier protein [Candidatus Omnitrophota bacterium]
MNLKEIKEIIGLMEEHGLAEIEIEKGDQKIKLRKTLKPELFMAAQQSPVAAGPARANEPSGQEYLQEKKSANVIEIKAPIVGTFYRAPSPDAAPFVEVGQEIEVGQVVCIIEAMKLMNEIKSEVKGKVVDVLVENADPIEFGQILMLIEPS